MNGEFDDAGEEVKEAIPANEGDEGGASLSPAERIQLLYQSLEQRTREAAEANETYLRASADFENYRKRMQRDLVEFRKYANEQMALELLTVVDHLGLALKHSNESGDAAQSLRQGVQLVYKQLCDVLEKFGIKRFPAEGEPFDPNKHEAMMQVSSGDVPENTVVQVLQDGYLYNEKILRHAKVGVSKKPDEAPHDPAENDSARKNTMQEEALPEEATHEEAPQEDSEHDSTAPGEATQEEHQKKKRKKR